MTVFDIRPYWPGRYFAPVSLPLVASPAEQAWIREIAAGGRGAVEEAVRVAATHPAMPFIANGCLRGVAAGILLPLARAVAARDLAANAA